MTRRDVSAIVSKLSASGRAEAVGKKKVLKKQKIMLDKTKTVWYTNQAVRETPSRE